MNRQIHTTVRNTYETIIEQFVDLDDLPGVPIALLTTTLFLWTVIYEGWLPMPSAGGSMTMSDPGVPEAMGTHNGVEGVVLYLLMWGVMMSAMMYPAMIPFVGRYVASMQASTTQKAKATVAFLGTYSLVWTATGVVPLAVDALVNLSAVAGRYGALLVGGAAIMTGAYQLTDFKCGLIRACCSDVATHEPSFEDAADRGVEHSLSCVRCTWALFALMVVVGSMNLFWMLLLTAVVTLERFAPRGKDVAATTGVALALGGAVLVAATALGV